MHNFFKSSLLVMLFGLVSLAAAADAPHWVKRGVKSLNSQRTNETYEFVSLNTHDIDLKLLKEEATEALKTYVDEMYNPVFNSIKITQVSESTNPEYKVDYKTQDGQENYIMAKLVDTYEEFNDFEVNVFQFEYYQLYAVSMPNQVPMYDNFYTTTNYNAQATVKSLIPGMGQIDKGQSTKGYVILGGEILLVGAGIYFDHERRYAKKRSIEIADGYFENSWNSKRQAWQNFEIISFGLAAGLYIYNLIDAATSTGVRQVKVKPNSTSYYITPVAAPGAVGMQCVVNF